MTLTRIGATHLLEHVAPLLTGRVLEVGCGPDYYRDVLFADATQRVTIDISFSHSPTVTADAHKLPFSAEIFDSIIASQVLEHLWDPGSALEEMHRVLRPDGSLVIAVPFLYPLHEVPHDYHRFTEWGLRYWLESAGFESVTICGYGGRLAVTLDLLTSPAEFPTPLRKLVTLGWRRLIRPKVTKSRFMMRAAVALATRRPGRHPAGYVATSRRRSDSLAAGNSL